MGQIKNIKLHIVTDIKKMVFTAVQTSAGNVARSHIRTLAMNPPKYNEPYFTADACTRQPLDTEVCLMCHIISHIQQKSKSTTKSDTLHISNLKTPCLAKKSEEVKTDDVSTTETEGERTEKLIVSLSKDMAEVNPSCVNSEKDALRQTIAEIVNHCCQEWIGAESESANIKAQLHRVQCTTGKSAKIFEVFAVYQLVLFIAVPGRSATVMIPICGDDMKILAHQSYAFFVNHTDSTFTAHTYKNFVIDKKLILLPCVKWVSNIFSKLLVNKDASGRSSKVILQKKKKKKKKVEVEEEPETEVVEEVTDDTEVKKDEIKEEEEEKTEEEVVAEPVKQEKKKKKKKIE